MSSDLVAWNGYDRERAEATEGCLDQPSDDMPARDEVVPIGPPADGYLARCPDPWQTDTLTAGDRVFHILNTDPDARHKGTGTVADRRRPDAWQVEYLVDYDKGGSGWHRSADVRKAGGDDVPPF